MSSALIETALKQSYVDGAFGLSTAYQNVAFDPSGSDRYAELYVLHNQPSVATLGGSGEDAHDGILQINLNYPTGKGPADVDTKAAAIEAYYKAGTRFTYNGQEVFIRSSGRSIGRQIDGFYQVIVTVFWEARTQR